MKKRILIPASFLLLLLACRKEQTPNPNIPALTILVQDYLQDHLSVKDFGQLDLGQMTITEYGGGIKTIKVPFKSEAPKASFVALKIERNDVITQAKIVTLTETLNGGDTKPVDKYTFHGNISIQTLNRQTREESTISDGYMITPQLFQSTIAQKGEVVPVVYTDLPEVVVVAHLSPNGTTSSTWVNLISILDGSTATGSASGYYENANPFVVGNNAGLTEYNEQPIKIDFEYGYLNPAIDISKYIKCFETVPDNGATYSVEIFTDIPVDDDPNKLFNWSSESPGHTFLQFKKSNGNKIVTQNIGFYPVSNWKTMLTPAPLKGKFVDNALHEYNASIKVNVDPENFKQGLTELGYRARSVLYDIHNYNCTDLALGVFNSVRSPSKQLEIPLYHIPGAQGTAGSSTPQGLYHKLKKMKDSKDPESPNILITNQKKWVGGSHGPCN